MLEHVFPGQGLEIELVRGVVVGGHGFGVGVDHDGLHPHLLQGEGGLAAAVVELDALADAVGAAAQDHDFAPVGLAGLVFPLVGGVKIGGVGLELGGAGVHQLVDRIDAVLPAQPADMLLVAAPEVGQLHGRRSRTPWPAGACPASWSCPGPGAASSRTRPVHRRNPPGRGSGRGTRGRCR